MRALLLALVLISGACAPTQAYVAAVKLEGTIATEVMDAYGAWRVYDRTHQDSIVAAATSAPAAAAQLKAWRALQSQVDMAFIDARKALQLYSDALNAAGAAQARDWSATIAALTTAVNHLLSLLSQFGVAMPAPKVTP